MARAPSVEAFMAALQHRAKPDIEALRQLILAACPGLTERIKWNAPSFGPGDDDRITMRLQPGDQLQLILHRGAKMRADDGFSFEDPHGLIEWASNDRGVVTITESPQAGGEDHLTDLVRRWIAATP
ncbi:DUF1801 domain-containing protein [Devosia sp.]|uniref:DUF1801 domain-containing protein n=1 Tax=Devosia sp. TaxID=1871048 RepID=UPI002FCB6DEF